MNLTKLVADPYNRRARLQPALLSILPIAAVALILFPALESKVPLIAGIITYFGGVAWLTQFGRDRGKLLEKKLFDHWGGLPSVVLLRHRDPTINKVTKERYHAFLSANMPGHSLPSSEDETKSPNTADESYASATDWLIARTREKAKYSLLFEENMNYGFRRNFWAMRPIALSVDILVIAGILGMHISVSPDTNLIMLDLNSPGWTALAVTGFHTCIVFLATKKWVYTAAHAYARQLLSACDALSDADSN